MKMKFRNLMTYIGKPTVKFESVLTETGYNIAFKTNN